LEYGICCYNINKISIWADNYNNDHNNGSDSDDLELVDRRIKILVNNS